MPPPSAPLPPDHVELWWLPVNAPADMWERVEPFLDTQERQRAARFRFAADRHAFIAAHGLVRAMLSAFAPVPPPAWRFTATAHGRPEVAPEMAEAAGQPPLRFNLSHTRRLVAAAVCRGHDIGIDTEDAERGSLTMDLADRFFAPAEVAHAAACPPDARTDTLYGFWTLKEAYIKAVGLGLSIPLDTFAFTLDPPAIGFSPHHPGDPAGWLFRRFGTIPAHPLALALRHPAPERVTVACRAVSLGALWERMA